MYINVAIREVETEISVEYAVAVLGVPDVIVCGHTDCGVMKGVLHPEALESHTNLSACWATRSPHAGLSRIPKAG